MKKVLLMLSMVTLLGGCGTTAKVWTKDGATQGGSNRIIMSVFDNQEHCGQG